MSLLFLSCWWVRMASCSIFSLTEDKVPYRHEKLASQGWAGGAQRRLVEASIRRQHRSPERQTGQAMQLTEIVAGRHSDRCLLGTHKEGN